ncbi:Metal-dependent peptidase (plasmid) [Pararobbsia alpina]|uniref:vWA domain-containing protein n=1 Tax=Pararobbsia alpina TaxID=621374 RepID=UPI0039A47E37
MDPRITKARTDLIFAEPFFGVLALRLEVVEDRSCRTFWVDGVSLGYNPDFLATLDPFKLRGVLAHEVMHVANGHCWRMGERDPKRWNDAADYSINPIVLEAGFELPAGVLVDKRFAGMSAEAIYAELRHDDAQKQASHAKPQPDAQSGQGSSQVTQPGSANRSRSPSTMPGQSPANDTPGGPCGEVRPCPAENPAKVEAEWKVAVLQAARAAKLAGKLTGGLEAAAHAAAESVVDWRAALHQFATDRANTDYSWTLPNRRYVAAGLYLPAPNEPSLGDAVFVRDSSGSVFDETQRQFAGEIISMFDCLKPRRLIVLDCDTQVKQVQIFEHGDHVDLLPVRGGGATRFDDPFKWLEREEIRPEFVVYLTDLDGTFPDDAPDYPVLWVSTRELRRVKARPSFGECIEVIA